MPLVLKRRSQFLEIGNSGFRAKTGILSVLCRKDSSLECPMIGYTASKRVGRAFQRNRAKRRLRALVRELCNEFTPGYSFVVIATSNSVMCKFDSLRSDFLYCIRKARCRADVAEKSVC
jgi:ribonuclease P protein component